MVVPCRRADLAAWCAALCMASVTAGTRAQPEPNPNADQLAAARSLFADGLRDEEAKRFVDALEKFRRVRTVRDTAQVEYRIGVCHEGLGQSVPAYVAYREATALGQADVRNAEVVAAANDRMQALEKHVARLTLALPEAAPADAEVRVDDKVVSPTALRDPIVLEPGPHVVLAAAPNAAPSRSEIVLPEGAHVSLTIPLGPSPAPATAVVQAATAPAPVGASPAPAETPPSTTAAVRRTAGWIAVGGGGALLAASAVVLLVRSSDIATLNRACPGGVCPLGANQSDLESTRSRALFEEPLSIALGAAGAVALGSGAYLVLTSKDDPPDAHRAGARVVPLVAAGAGGIAVAGEFP